MCEAGALPIGKMAERYLYDLAVVNGGPSLIPRELCAADRIGVSVVWMVLVHRLLYADVTGVHFQGTPAVADDLCLPRRTVQRADAILEAAGLMERIGKRSRAVAYRMLPHILDCITRNHEAQVDDPDDVDEVLFHADSRSIQAKG